jgi:hypothetical protein
VNVRMKNKELVFVAIVSLVVATIVMVQPISHRPFKPFRPFEKEIDPESLRRRLAILPYYMKAKTILSSVNSVLLLSLFVTYLEIYRKTGSEFSLGLVIFSLAIFFNTITSNPLIHWFTGFPGSGLGPFTMLPDLFTCIASAILLYLSRQ